MLNIYGASRFMIDIKYRWCSRYTFGGRLVINMCYNWICKCSHSLRSHDSFLGLGDYKCIYKCDCTGFEYDNNDFCTVDCMFQRKIMEIDYGLVQ